MHLPVDRVKLIHPYLKVTTPLLLLELLLSSGMPLGDIVFTIFMDVSSVPLPPKS